MTMMILPDGIDVIKHFVGEEEIIANSKKEDTSKDEKEKESETAN